MPAIREHDIVSTNADDDDGMPPLVDNPNPSMTFTFFTDMSPITALSADPTVPFETIWENPVPASPLEFAEPPGTQATFHGPERVSHGKKRDASYIPRPPNAFILFRSSFIRSQQVPEKVEGNHSTLSKIIGKYWKTLPREEREVWEAKALVAQAEHRRRYPDWRFRPGANALAKLKVKDGPQTPSRRRSGQGGRKPKANSAGKSRKSGDERCAMIADLLVEGKTGVDLEDAVKRWEDCAGRDVDRKANNANGGDEPKEVALANESKCHEQSISHGARDSVNADASPSIRAKSNEGCPPTQARAQTPDAIPDHRFRVPLTAMFKRSLSAPADQITSHDSFDSAFANITYDTEDSPQRTCSPPSFSGEQREDAAHAVFCESIGNLSPLVLPSILGDGVPARWNDPYNLLETPIGLASTNCPELTYALDSPSGSPVDQSFGTYSFYSTNPDFDRTIPPGYTQDMQNSYCSLKSWADCAPLYEQIPIFVNEYAEAPTAYDWCTTNNSMYRGRPDALNHYPSDTGRFVGPDMIRVHTEGGYLPTVAY
ncbi:hypothetical protein PAXRUDRAFT_826992 [Paxillus rubicundulus Ve08.2h10]|uniref:HMG box domain-containing protein n=1 Tax=Paxillus rubicundulus Ve08.2h10 TaxID=930991 RepID=A0A0D0DYV9_9AGAM|nr:hypothetical protein PAXRUDRAFT_826992 [Paxillus rubicundulus Ve08.2h10]